MGASREIREGAGLPLLDSRSWLRAQRETCTLADEACLSGAWWLIASTMADVDPAFRARLKTIFDKFDEDQGGDIDTMELGKVMQQLGQNCTEAELHVRTHAAPLTAHQPRLARGGYSRRHSQAAPMPP